MRMYPPEEGMRVLDVGCGTGTNLDIYHAAGCRVFGIDVSAAMLAEAGKKLGDRAELRLGSASDMCYADDSFDLVVGMLTLHEMRPEIRSQAMNEMARVVKNEGRILLVDYHPGPARFPGGWTVKAFIHLIEIAAGRENFKNFRDFLAGGGVPGLTEKLALTTEKTGVFGGGNLGAYLLRAQQTGCPVS